MTQHYTSEFEALIRAWACQQIPAKRLQHVEGVVEMVDELACRFAPEDIMLVRLAGWIHDVAKALSDEELLNAAERFGWPVSPIERDAPQLLHGAISYLMADENFKLNDQRLQSACVLHTTGGPGMNTTDKIVMLGDAIEHRTRDYDGVDEIRTAASINLDTAVLMLVDRTLEHLIRRGRVIDPRAVDLRNELLRSR